MNSDCSLPPRAAFPARATGQFCAALWLVAVTIWLLTARSTSVAVFDIADGDATGLIAAIHTANTNNQDDVINLAVSGTCKFIRQ